jgi:signal transduction histidine kinase
MAMAGRVFLVLIGGIIVSAIVSVALTARQHRHELAEMQTARTIERVSEAVAVLQSMPRDLRENVEPRDLRIRGITGIYWQRDELGAKDAALSEALQSQIGGGGTVTTRQLEPSDCDDRPPMRDGPPVHDGRPDRDRPPPPPFDLKLLACQRVSMTLADGTPLSLDLAVRMPFARRPLAPPWGSLLFFATCVGVLAYLVSRMATRPITRLADAARELGENINRAPLDETHGPVEVRRAAAAFNAMQARIRHHMQERTHMLAAISHDLQTPLTRLRLRLEKVGDAALREKLIEDMQAMQAMVREGLDLAHSIDGNDARERIDVDSLVGSLCADAREAGHSVDVNGETGVAVMASPTALRRCLGNLIDNALKYGQRAELTVSRDGGNVLVNVRDFGPGIPAAELERVFDPFYRLEDSRSRETGGTGLGLTIARNIATRLGGSVTLRNHPEGGLEARLALPVAS